MAATRLASLAALASLSDAIAMATIANMKANHSISVSRFRWLDLANGLAVQREGASAPILCNDLLGSYASL